ncbi:transcription elongation regulator 1-like protein isoform X2 [Larimichthys crocea]|uniref:transcription elongation regulator 1-like protein isoform X2 n=1 Tax=Larimichthys crocea TaxID=215358 RepID=UPI000F6033BA|nr:transcription elongation regulator 1-like protein isoform X2 [Larimichthys crocea]
MMLPVSRFKGQPVGLVTTTRPWWSISTDPVPHWLWLTSWSAETYQTTPPPVFYPPAVWIPGHTHLTQWERPAVEVVPLFSPFYCSSNLYSPHPLPKLADTWITPDEVGGFQGIDKPLLLTNQMIQRPRRHAPQIRMLLSPQFSGCSRRDATKMQYTEPEDLSSSSSSSSLASSSSLLHLLSLSQFQLIHRAPPPTGGDYSEQAGLTSQGVGPLVLTSQQCRRACLRPIISLDIIQSTPTQHGVFGPISPQLYTDRWPVLPVQVMKEIHPSIFSSHFSSRFTLLTDYRHNKQGMNGRKRSLLLTTERMTDNKQCVGVPTGVEDKQKNKHPVASTPVPGSPWCVVWTGDDRVFFFNPTIHLSVWERPGDLIGRDISSIIEDPPHKRKRTTRAKTSSSCKSIGHHDDDKDDDHEHDSKRNRMEEPMSLVPCPGEVKLLPLNIRVAHFREMMLERGVSAFSTWEKELHKMVFDPRYLLLTSDQRKQEFDQFVKRRLKDEYKEKKSKLQKAREEFKQLLEEAKITSRSTFKEFCACYRGDQRFNALNRKKEQEVLFQHYITSLKKRDKENRARLRKMR